MNIYFDNIIFSLQKAGGISVYWKELLCRAIRDKLNFTCIEQETNFENIFKSEIVGEYNSIIQRKWPVMFARYLSVEFKCDNPNSIFHSSYYRVPNNNDSIVVQTLYDFTYEYYRAGIAKHVHAFQRKKAVNRSQGLIFISESTRQDFLKFHPELSEVPNKVIYLGYSDSFNRLVQKPKNIMDDEYLVFVGARSGYKNFHLAVNAVAQFEKIGLVIVGGGQLTSDEQKHLESKLKGRYTYQGFLSNERLNEVYNNAFALIYPSNYEGFGIPIIEAMAAGCPVIANNISSIPEAGGDVALLCNTISSEQIASKILLLKNEEFRQKIILKGLEHVKHFSWEKCYQDTILFYDTLIQANK